MSGIVGLYYFDGRTVGEELDRMVGVMDHRGPDGIETWREGSVGLGHLLLRTTPEALHEMQPLVDRSGNFVLAADARIDNRKELAGSLDIAKPRGRPITDSELILAAYKEWGRECPEKLLGAFAFAVWDRQQRQIFCARDHVGVKPFYYFKSGNCFVFGSEIKALRECPFVQLSVNEQRIGDYLANVFYDRTSTFYKNIYRLAPGHWMTVSQGGVEKRRYWQLNPNREIHFDSDEEYAETFRNILTEAVRCRLRTVDPAGALLSGGLDSSSVCAVAGEILKDSGSGPLHTFSTVYDDFPECNERRYIEKVLEHGTYISRMFPYEDNAPISAIREMIDFQDEPFYAPNLSGTWRRYEKIREAGGRVVLDGHGGDEVVSHGYGRLKELAQDGHWLKLYSELRGASQIAGSETAFGLWLDYVTTHGKWGRAGRSWVYRFARRLAQVANRGRRVVSEKSPRAISWEEIMDDCFKERVTPKERLREVRADGPHGTSNEQQRHYKTLMGNLGPHAFEVLDRASGACEIELRYPFWDKRLVEFCLALPSDQKLREGWGRFVLRQATQELLPPEVAWRRDKTDFLPVLLNGMRSEEDAICDLFLTRSEVAKDYIDVDSVRNLYNALFAPEPSLGGREVFLMWKVAVLVSWLDHTVGS